MHRKGKYLKFMHNVMMNAFATIYFHNYLRMDEMPRIGRREVEPGKPDQTDAQTPGTVRQNICTVVLNCSGLHISTFTRQMAFDILYFSEFVILLGYGFSAQIVKDGYLNLYTDKAFVSQPKNLTLYGNIGYLFNSSLFSNKK